MANTPTTYYAINKPASGDTGWGTTMNADMDTIDTALYGMAQLAGRSGGQTLYGGTAANEDLHLKGTAHGTKTTSYVTLQADGGYVGIGTTAPLSKLNVVDTSSSSPRGILSTQISTDTNGARVGFAKARGTAGGETTVVTGDTLGRLMFRGYDGSNYLEMASVEVGASGTVASTRVPTYMAFSTATDAAPSVLTERMRIDNAGNVGIGVASPTVRLDVSGPVKIVGTSSGDTTLSVSSLAGNNQLRTVGNATPRVLVGVGTDDNSTNLQVFGTVSTTGTITVTNNIAVQWKDSGGTARRLFLLSASDASYFGPSDTGWGGTTYLKAGTTLLMSVNTATSAVDAVFVATTGKVGIGTTSPDSLLHVNLSDTGTNTITRVLTITHNGGTAAAGFGTGILFELESSTTEDQTAAAIDVAWSTATHASRASYMAWSLVTNAGSLTEAMRLTGEQNLKLGGTASRGTAVGTNHIDLFDGTAPTGTLANGVSIYSKAGEFYALDAAGNETLNSPHDPETGEWIFWSRNTVTGRTYRVDMERMVAAIEALTGQSFTTETFESLSN